MSIRRNRVAAGSSAGGQYAPETHTEAGEIDLMSGAQAPESDSRYADQGRGARPVGDLAVLTDAGPIDRNGRWMPIEAAEGMRRTSGAVAYPGRTDHHAACDPGVVSNRIPELSPERRAEILQNRYAVSDRADVDSIGWCHTCGDYQGWAPLHAPFEQRLFYMQCESNRL